jgi:class 3 adenylate cyclase
MHIAHDREASVMFSDIVSFTSIAASQSPEDVVALLNIMFNHFDKLTTAHRVYKVETIGDAYFACSGVVNQQSFHTVTLLPSYF